MEASGQARWFERLLAELNVELWLGDAAEIRAKRVRKKKTDREDARHILRLLVEDRFPRIWVPSWDNRDVRQLLWHRHRMVQMRTRIMNQLQAVALNEGLRCKKRLWRENGRKQLEAFHLAPWASRRRRDLLELLDRLNPTITELTHEIEQEVEKYPAAQRLMTHPGVGALTALAFVLVIGNVERFGCGKQIASYVGLVPAEDSSGERRRNAAFQCFQQLQWLSWDCQTLENTYKTEKSRVIAVGDLFLSWASDKTTKCSKTFAVSKGSIVLTWIWMGLSSGVSGA